MRLDLHPEVEKLGRAASAALPAIDQVRSARLGREGDANHRQSSTCLVCDVCGSARPRDERHRLVWERDPGTRLVLAELCRGCAAGADPLLQLYGGRGREAIRLVAEIRVSPPARKAPPRVFGYAARGIVYVLIAMAAFVLVTLATSGVR
jgi:hypothetical protein